MSQKPSPRATALKRELPPGLIFDVARAAGIEVTFEGRRQTLPCPFHEDQLASAFLSPNNIFYCSVCTPEGGWPAKRFAAQLGVDWLAALKGISVGLAAPSCESQAPEILFTSEMAQAVWRAAHARARDDEYAHADGNVYAYLARREILGSWEVGAFGVLGEGMVLPKCTETWRLHGYRIVVPLYDERGDIANVQARAIRPTEIKTRFPTGSRANGVLFASESGQDVLRGGRAGEDVILGEGLTDFLALSIASRVPVLSAPGTSFCAKAIGRWVRGRRLLLALDCDAAGDAVVDAVRNAAQVHGATSVIRLRWPENCKDACDLVALRGCGGLAAFLANETRRCAS